PPPPTLFPYTTLFRSVPDFAHPLLRLAQTLVAQHTRQERRPLGLAERRHHRQLLLAGEVRVEELVVGHAQRALELAGDRFEGIRDRKSTRLNSSHVKI